MPRPFVSGCTHVTVRRGSGGSGVRVVGLSNWGLAYQLPPLRKPFRAFPPLPLLPPLPDLPPPPEGVAWLSGQLPETSPGCCLRHQWHRSTRALPRVQTLPLVHWPDWNFLQSPSPFLLDVKCPSPSFAEWSSVPELHEVCVTELDRCLWQAGKDAGRIATSGPRKAPRTRRNRCWLWPRQEICCDRALGQIHP